MARRHPETRTGGRAASTGVIPGDYALSVGCPKREPPSGWSWRRLDTIARLETGHTPSRREPEYWGGDIPWIGIKDASPNNGRTLHGTQEGITDAGLANSSARLLPANTVCLSRTASIGYVVVMGRPMATSQDFVNWVCTDEIDHRFLKYILLAERNAFSRFASGSTHQTIYFPEVKAFHVCLPPQKQQDAIASFLQTIDDKIELNRRGNETLEALASTLFNTWSVQVESNTEDAIPDGRWSPQEWSVCSLLDLYPDQNKGLVKTGPFGSKLHASDYSDNGVPLVLVKHVQNGHIAHDGSPLVSLEKVSEVADYALKPNDIVVTRVGRVGDAALVEEHQAGWLFSGQTLRVRLPVGGPLTPLWLHFWFQSQRFKTTIDAHAVGSTRASLNTSILERMQLVLPPEELQARFESVAKPVWRRMGASRLESTTLEQLRDTLLPKLISGELRVPDAERIVSEAL